MGQREELIVNFLTENGLERAAREKVASDASFRHYERLSGNKRSVMLMNAPPGKEEVGPFCNIANYLRRRGLSAPEVYAKDVENGFLLLEDFGRNSFTNVLAGSSFDPGSYNERGLYLAAIDVLIQLGRSTLPSNMPDYDGELLMKECQLLTDWYLPNVRPEFNKPEFIEQYNNIWNELLSFGKAGEDVVVLRDFHADNLMWLPERTGVRNVGLLDFQDAVIGSPVYDIVSLLEDARRDVSDLTVQACINHYLNNRKSIDRDKFMAIYAILAAQRNCKIVGIFARLAIRDGKKRYLNYLPRVWQHLENGLLHPILKPLKTWLNLVVPPIYRKPSAFQSSKKEYAVG